MKAKVISMGAHGFVGISVISLLYVSGMAIVNPQAVMDLVGVTLPNNDAISSIRGVYGGVGITIVGSLVFLVRKDVEHGLSFLTVFWGAYALSRVLTILVEGSLESFGNQWLVIEAVFAVLGGVLLLLLRNVRKSNK